MSLATDREYHVRRLRLALLRYALPSGTSSDGPAPNTYSTTKAWAIDSHFLHFTELDDRKAWPELRSGRHSPPLVWSFRNQSNAAKQDGRGATGLRYTDTIGVRSHLGMRVNRRERLATSSKSSDLKGKTAGPSSAGTSELAKSAHKTPPMQRIETDSLSEQGTSEQEATSDVDEQASAEQSSLQMFRSTSPVENRAKPVEEGVKSSHKLNSSAAEGGPSEGSSFFGTGTSRTAPLSRRDESSEASLAFTNRDSRSIARDTSTSEDHLSKPHHGASMLEQAESPSTSAQEPGQSDAFRLVQTKRTRKGLQAASIDFKTVPVSSNGAQRPSALSTLIQAEDNKKASAFAGLLSKAADAIKLSIYFPQSQAATEPMSLSVRRDLTVNEVIIASVYSYSQSDRMPPIKVSKDNEIEREASHWSLRIVEDDGEVDEDFPALDRGRGVASFRFPSFGLVRNPPLRAEAPKAASPSTGAGVSQSPAVGLGAGSVSVGGNQVLVRIRIKGPSARSKEHFELQADPTMRLKDALDKACVHFDLRNAQGWGLVAHFDDADLVLPLDRTVATLGESRDLTIAGPAQLAAVQAGRRRLASSDDIVQTQALEMTQPPEDLVGDGGGYVLPFQRFTVHRRMPMPLGRHPRVLAIDGEYVHSLPPADARGLLDGGVRTHSYHISNIKDCRLSTRSPVSFKLVVQKDRREKVYLFEADTPQDAQNIVATIRTLLDGSY